MLENRVMPCLLIKDNKLVKTIRFKNPEYIGDPINAIKIFNEKEVDELIIADISENRSARGPNLELIRRTANECFMPVCYGGGISTIEQIQAILKIGIEKVALNSALFDNPSLIEKASKLFGSQCIVVALDIKKNLIGRYRPAFNSGTKMKNIDLLDFMAEIENLGAGEILINDISREGTWEGFNLELLKKISSSSKIPVIAMGGAGNTNHIIDAIKIGKVSAVAIGSMAVYQRKGMGVLINFPDKDQLNRINNL